MTTNLVLASGSPRRADILKKFHIHYFRFESRCEEEVSVSDPREAVMELARRKAERVYVNFEKRRREATETTPRDFPLQDFVYVGADTVVVLDGEILGKPKDEEEAKAMIRRLAGRSHKVYTGVHMIFACEEVRRRTFVEETTVHVRPMTEAEIDKYVSYGESLDKAGGYSIQGLFGLYVTGIEGDYYNVVGLPIGKVHEALLQEGFDLIDF